MSFFDAKIKTSTFFLILAITLIAWVLLSLWWMSSFYVPEDETGWGFFLAAVPSGLLAYSVYCYLKEKESRLSPVLGAILALLISGIILSSLLRLFQDYLMTQLVAVALATLVCVISFIFAIKEISKRNERKPDQTNQD